MGFIGDGARVSWCEFGCIGKNEFCIICWEYCGKSWECRVGTEETDARGLVDWLIDEDWLAAQESHSDPFFNLVWKVEHKRQLAITSFGTQKMITAARAFFRFKVNKNNNRDTQGNALLQTSSLSTPKVEITHRKSQKCITFWLSNQSNFIALIIYKHSSNIIDIAMTFADIYHSLVLIGEHL